MLAIIVQCGHVVWFSLVYKNSEDEKQYFSSFHKEYLGDDKYMGWLVKVNSHESMSEEHNFCTDKLENSMSRFLQYTYWK